MAKVLLNWMVGEHCEVQAQHDLLTEHGWQDADKFTRWTIVDLDVASMPEAIDAAVAHIEKQLDVTGFRMQDVIDTGAGHDGDVVWDINLHFFTDSLNKKYPIQY